MAEHDITEAMVEAACAAIVCEGENVAWSVLHGCESLLDAESSENNADGAKQGSAASVYVRCIVRTALEAGLAARTTPIAGSEPVAQKAADDAYNAIDRYLRNNMDDATYAEYENYLQCVFDSPHPTGTGADAGWVLVPREPTPEMCRAGFLSEPEGFDIETPADAPSLVYRAMIAASPQQRAPHPPSVRESAGEGE